MTEDCVWGNAGFPPAVGIKDIIAKHEASERVFGDYELHIDLLNIASNGDVVFTERVDQGRERDTGAEILTVQVTGVFELRDGRICRWVDYFDPRGLLERLAVLPDIAEFFAGTSSEQP
jgi:limonene-1,2-epoxide hydrolase